MRHSCQFARLALLGAALASFSTAITVSGTGPGGSIPPGAPAAASGTFTSNATFSSGGVVASGNAVTVTLIGLQHDWSGDLIATLSYVNGSGNVVQSASLFYRIGQTTNQPDGSWAGFGAPGPTGDNYAFNTDYAGNITALASTLGFADSIPGQQTDTVNGGQYFSSDAGGVKNNLSYAFTGLNIAGGTWRLTIVDSSAHSAEGGTISNIGSLVGWRIDIQTGAGSGGDFSLSANPGSQNIMAGGNTSFAVNASSLNEFNGSVGLNVSGLPSGATGTFTPASVSLATGTGTSTLAISSLSTIAAGTYTLTISGQAGSLTHSITATLNVSPASPTVNPSSGSGSTQSFTFTFPGTSYNQVHMLFNSALTGLNACYFIYDLTVNGIYIATNDGTHVTGPATPGSSTVLSNGQCSVPASSFAASTASGNVSVAVSVNFQSAFAGPKNTYVNWFDRSWNAGTWNQIGSWTVTASTNSPAVTPSSGSGSTQSFTSTFPGTSYNQVHMLFNSALTGLNACYFIYDVTANVIYMATDDGTHVTGPATPGSNTVLSNSQCSVAASSFSVSTAGGNLSVTAAISFNSSFAGSKNTYINWYDPSWNPGTWAQVGSWTVTSPSLAVTPSSGSGSSQTFAFTFPGLIYNQVHVIFNSSLTGTNACYFIYDTTINGIYMATDDGTHVTGPATPGSNTAISNSQCSVPASSFSVSTAGGNLSVTATINFNPSFAGAKNTYLNWYDRSWNPGSWTQVGTWTVTP